MSSSPVLGLEVLTTMWVASYSGAEGLNSGPQAYAEVLLTKPSPINPRHSPLLMLLRFFFYSKGTPKIKVSEEAGDSYCIEILGGNPKELPHDKHDFDVGGDFL